MERDIATSSILMEPKLPNGVADYKGLLRCCRIIKFVLLKDDDDESVVVGVCHSVFFDLVGGNEGPLGLNKVAV